MRRATNAIAETSVHRERRVVAATLLLLTLLLAEACGVNPIHEPSQLALTPTPTALPLPAARPDRSALYYRFSARQPLCFSQGLIAVLALPILLIVRY